MKNKFLLYSLLLGLFGAVFLILEYTFYQNINEEGFLQESWLLPLGFIALFISILLLFIFVLKSCYSFFKKKIKI